MNISLKPILHSSYFKEPSGLNLIGEDRIRLVNIIDGIEVDVIGPYLNLWDCDNLVSGLISKEFFTQLLDNLFETYSPITSLVFDNEWVKNKDFWRDSNGDYYMTVEFSLPSEFGTPITYNYPNLRSATFESSDGTTTIIQFMNDNPDFDRVRVRLSRSSGKNTEVVIDPVNLDNSTIIQSELQLLGSSDDLMDIIESISGMNLIDYGDLSEYISFTSYVRTETQDNLIEEPVNYNNVQNRSLNLKSFYLTNSDNTLNQEVSQIEVEVPKINPESDILQLEIKYLKSGIIENVTYPDNLKVSTYLDKFGDKSNIIYSRNYVDLYKSTLTNDETGNFEVINFDGSPVSYGDILEYCISISLAINKFEGSSFIMNLGDLSLEYSNDGVIIFPNVDGIQEYFISKCTVLKLD